MEIRVLLVEDEEKLALTLQQSLENIGIQATIALNGEEGFSLASTQDYNVIVSDIMMPGISGLKLIQNLRAININTPVILLTALGQTEDKVEAFEIGADDYLTKPFEWKELVVRIKALARRYALRSEQNTQKTIQYENLELDLRSKEVKRNHTVISLTPKEWDLLLFFIQNTDRVINRQEIAEKVWNLDFDPGTNIIDVYVNFLRKKIDKGFEPKLIHTLYKTGFIFKVMDDADQD